MAVVDFYDYCSYFQLKWLIKFMDNLQSELNELKQFIADLKADRAATKEKERREAWTKYVSLTIVVFAVVGSIASQWSGKYSSMTQMSQAQASDQWNYYEALSVKQHMFELTRTQLSKTASDAETAKAQQDFEAKIADYKAREARSKDVAERLESKRDMATQIGGRLGLANSCFAVAIATASLCMLTKKKPLWFCSMIFAVAAIAEMVFAKMIKIP
jgi:23S rRNA pseudoU1915 N3-methylase RlmH